MLYDKMKGKKLSITTMSGQFKNPIEKRVYNTFNNISVISSRSVDWWRKLECPEKAIDLPQFSEKLYRIML